jgi:hypothetical protein
MLPSSVCLARRRAMRCRLVSMMPAGVEPDAPAPSTGFEGLSLAIGAA